MADFHPLDNVGGWISGMVRNLDQWMKPTTLEKPTIPRPAPPPTPVVRPRSGPISPLPFSQQIENEGFISPLPTGQAALSPSPSPIPSPTPEPFAGLSQYGTPSPPQIIAELIKKYFPPEEWENAARVAFGESSYRPDLVGPTNDYGLFQISPKWQSQNLAKQGFAPEDMMDPEKNVQFASWLQSQQGWNPWVAAKIAGIVPE
jgi:hypothetical protein